jgi:hypothetical protein
MLKRKVELVATTTSLLDSREIFNLLSTKQVEYEQSTPEPKNPLHTEPLPPRLQWWDKERFWLIHSASGLQVPGTWTADEAELILDLSRNWNWSIDGDRRVACGLQLIALAEAVCTRSSQIQKGGES